LTIRRVDAGWRASRSFGRIGRRTSSPLQLGQRPASTPSAQSRQKVHSKEQMRASSEWGGKSRSQHSQLGLSSSIVTCSNAAYSRPILREKVGRGERLSL
jgi:hypothetical protein